MEDEKTGTEKRIAVEKGYNREGVISYPRGLYFPDFTDYFRGD